MILKPKSFLWKTPLELTDDANIKELFKRIVHA